MKIAAIYNFINLKSRAEGAFLEMIFTLQKRGHEIQIFALDISEEIKNELKEKGINVFSSKNIKREHKFYQKPFRYFKIIRYWKKISKRINKSNYSLAFVCHFLYSPLILPFLKIPKVYYCYEPHRKLYETPYKTKESLFVKVAKPVLRKIDKHSVSHADLILTNSDYEREYIYRTYGIFPVTNYLAVDLKKYRNLNLPKENLIVSVGVLDVLKAHDFVIKSIALIPEQKRPKFILITGGATCIACAKEYKKELYSLAKQKGVDLEIKDEYISHQQFLELHSRAKTIAIAYIMEPSIEPVALGCETPIVAIREGGARETILNKKTGLLTDRDEKKFAKAIEYLLDNPDIAEKMGKLGREWIKENFTWEICGENLEKNLKNLLERVGKKIS